MDYVDVVIDAFWAIMEQSVQIAVPIICIILIFSIVKGLLFKND